MNLISIAFLVFCAVTLITYFIIPKKFQWIVLLLSSIIFLFYNNLSIFTVVQALLVLIPSYFLGRKIEGNSNTKKGKRFLILGIIIIVGQLICYKYINIFIESANLICELLHSDRKFALIENSALIGISYYSLIMISYLIDIYRGTCKSQKNIFKCALFMSYFPILTSGPFIKYKDVENDLYGEHKFNYDRALKGFIRILWGVFKILVISQRLGMYVDVVYSKLTIFSGIYTILAVLAFPLQLYTNFSGSIDVIMGISEILGIKLPENFNLPFFSKTITEFWRRWHITLGVWLKDYIFYPLLKSDDMQELNKKCKKKFGKKVAKKIPLYASMLVMWIIIGVWHGGAYTYIIGSGILQFIFMVLEDLLAPVATKVNSKLGIKEDVFSYKLYQVIRTYLLFAFAMIFFRAESIEQALFIIAHCFVWNLNIMLDEEFYYVMPKIIGLDRYDVRVLIIALVVLFIVQLLARKGDVREKFLKQNIVFRWGVLYALMFAIIIFGCYGEGYDATAFIYREF